MALNGHPMLSGSAWGLLVEFHLDETGHVVFKCPHMGWALTLPWDGRWTLVSADPLTVVPSIHMTGCGCHGFIIDGDWVAV